MRTVYVYVMDTMADWETGYVLAELNSRRFFKKNAGELVVKTFAVSKTPIRSMGGLTIIPDLSMEEVVASQNNVLILPGSDTWGNPENFAVLDLANKFLQAGGLVAAICGATVALAAAGILDERKHTSNGAGFLNMFCPTYQGTEYYIDEAAVRDGNLITAAGTGALMMAKLVIEYLDVFREDTLKHWYNYFSTGDANAFFAMLQSLEQN